MPSGIYKHRRGKPSSIKGKTYVEFYGKEKAAGIKRRQSKSRRGKKFSEEAKKNMRGHSGVYSKSEEHKEKLRKSSEKYWENPENRKRQSASAKTIMLRRWQSSDGREKMLEALTCPATKAKRYEVHNRLEVKANHRAAGKRNWQNSEYVALQMKVKKVKPNKPEIILDKLLQKLFPNEYKYVGDGEFILAGRCPDFINVNGQKKIIELYGDYWHSEKVTGRTKIEEEKQRIAHFAKFGYKTLIIWEHELEDVNNVMDKLKAYNVS